MFSLRCKASTASTSGACAFPQRHRPGNWMLESWARLQSLLQVKAQHSLQIVACACHAQGLDRARQGPHSSGQGDDCSMQPMTPVLLAPPKHVLSRRSIAVAGALWLASVHDLAAWASQEAAADGQGQTPEQPEGRRSRRKRQQSAALEAQPPFDDPSPAPRVDSSNIAPGQCLSPGSSSTGTFDPLALPLNPISSPSGWAFKWPCGWTQVQGLTDSIGIVASFYNPQLPGLETLALYTATTDLLNTEALGTVQQVGQELADVAPFGELKQYSSFVDNGITYYVVRVMFGGNTAGMFGAVMECRCIAVHKGVKYTLRVTTSRYRWLAYPTEVPVLLDAVAASLRVPV